MQNGLCSELCPLTVTSPILAQAIHIIAHRHITPCMIIMEASGGTRYSQFERGWYKEKSMQSTTNSIQLGQLISTVLDKSKTKVLCKHKTSFLFMVISVYRPRYLTYQQKTGHGKIVFDMITPW